MSRKNEPARAEDLIRKALEISAKRMDRPGLAEAHRQYGLFFRSHAVNMAAEHYREEGFLDTTVRFEDRYAKAIEHFNASRDLFETLGRYDALASVYVSLAKTYDLTNRQNEACQAFNKSLESFARYKMMNQKLDEHRSEEIARYIDYVDAMKTQSGCPDATVPIISPPPPPASSPPPSRPAPAASAAP